jgi:hypothetical protein
VIKLAEQRRWRLYFADPRRHWPEFTAPVAQRFAARLPELSRVHGRLRGQPFLLGPDGLPDGRIHGFFTSHQVLGLDEDTWRKYAFALAIWLNFLLVRGVTWDEARPEDVEAFKHWRMTDQANSQRVAPGTVKGNLIALNVFYRWVGERHGVVNPVVRRATRDPSRGVRGSVAEIAAAPIATRTRDLKWFTPAGYRRWRDTGLRGFGLDGLEDPAWRGRNEQRDSAFADALFETGLRLDECASLLTVELPPDDPSRVFTTCWLADACAKVICQDLPVVHER